ncbi:MAG: peptidylprolyl isomerase [Chlamydiales bacterium]
MKRFLLIGLMCFLVGCQSSKKESSSMKNPTVTIRTNYGDIQAELFADKAPLTVENFLSYVDEKYYNQTIFHRVIDGFMIQGGGLTANMQEKKTHEPIRNEADNRLSNTRGTLAMARTSDIHSATSQFFINVADNDFLNYRNPTPTGFGYCTFGKVSKGMEVVDEIKKVQTTTVKGHENVPVKPVEIIEIVRNLPGQR